MNLSRRWALLAGALACAHATHVDRGDASGEGDRAHGGEEKKHDRRSARLPPSPERPPVAATPDALLVEGGAGQIQGALAERGYLRGAERDPRLDEPTSAALRRFQHDQGLAATGAPDRETLHRLGLDPSRLYRTHRPDEGGPRYEGVGSGREGGSPAR